MSAGVADALATVTVIGADVAVLPAASRTTAVSTRDPSVTVDVSQATAYGAAMSSAPIGTLSTRNRTPATPTSSDAPAVTVVEPETVAPGPGEVIVTVGGVVSVAAAPSPVTSKASMATK